MMNLVKINETRFEGTYVLEDSGKSYIYDEKTNDLHEASNVELGFYKTSKYSTFDCECDNWRSW